MLKRFLASLGIGAAKIDLILDKHHIVMGEEVTGKIILKGGEVEQKVDGLNVHLRLSSKYKKGDHTLPVNETVATVPVFRESFIVSPGESKEFPFSFTCPKYLPVSSLNTRYYFQTELDIQQGLDAKDIDAVAVIPSGLLFNLLEGFKLLGMTHLGEGYTGQRDGGWQIIQFHATREFRGEYDEIVFMYQPRHTEHRISGYFELDKQTRGLLGMIADELDLDERKGSFSFGPAELESPQKAAETIREFIRRNSEGLIAGW
ncbi:sporulation protein [Staphylospora marina]|uniref:sporulation protein n=1 Tax=Staphylospora marina TaxID=2490858 RepID=UPI0013DE49E8|nr:sporulation protein [Staphylospora marina]